MARLLRDAVREIANEGKPSFAGPVRQAPDGRLRVQVFPATAFDRITFPQTTAEVWMQPGVTRESLAEGQAAGLRRPRRPRRHGARAGGGQRGFARAPRRALQALRRGQGRRDEGQPGQRLPGAALEASPRLADRRRRTRASSRAALRSGSISTGHPLIDEVHITGSDKTYDAVVFGTGAEGARRKAADEPVLDKAGDGGAGQRVAGDRGARASGRSPNCGIRPSTWPACWSTMRASTASRPGSSSPTPPGPSAMPSSAR